MRSGRLPDPDREQGDAGGTGLFRRGQGGRRVGRRTVRYDDADPVDAWTSS